jgi:midasin (ATPase involved in ribosome maturation)
MKKGVEINEENKKKIKLDIQSKIIQSIEFLYEFNKFIYITSLSFQNLIYKGFCSTEETKEEPLEGDEELDFGTGMGEGTGGENVADEMEFEE